MSPDISEEGRVSFLISSCTLTRVKDPRSIVWFDIDNTLYSASTKISQAMGQRIHGSLVFELPRTL
jgi:hypothetical protein